MGMTTFSAALLERIAARFKMLGDPTRLAILNALRGGERTVTEIVTATGTSQANVSRHLSLLHRAALVGRRKDGLHVYYEIADPELFRLCDSVCAALETEVEREGAVMKRGRAARRS